MATQLTYRISVDSVCSSNWFVTKTPHNLTKSPKTLSFYLYTWGKIKINSDVFPTSQRFVQQKHQRSKANTEYLVKNPTERQHEWAAKSDFASHSRCSCRHLICSQMWHFVDTKGQKTDIFVTEIYAWTLKNLCMNRRRLFWDNLAWHFVLSAKNTATSRLRPVHILLTKGTKVEMATSPVFTADRYIMFLMKWMKTLWVGAAAGSDKPARQDTPRPFHSPVC